MGQRAIRGRAFAEGDDRPGAAPVAVLSHRYWQEELSRREDAVGQTMQIGREHFTVVGVMTPELEFGNIAEIDVWLPLRIDPAGPRDARNLRFLARLKAAGDYDVRPLRWPASAARWPLIIRPLIVAGRCASLRSRS
jgi:hypothetical protein